MHGRRSWGTRGTSQIYAYDAMMSVVTLIYLSVTILISELRCRVEMSTLKHLYFNVALDIMRLACCTAAVSAYNTVRERQQLTDSTAITQLHTQ